MGEDVLGDGVGDGGVNAEGFEGDTGGCEGWGGQGRGDGGEVGVGAGLWEVWVSRREGVVKVQLYTVGHVIYVRIRWSIHTLTSVHTWICQITLGSCVTGSLFAAGGLVRSPPSCMYKSLIFPRPAQSTLGILSCTAFMIAWASSSLQSTPFFVHP